MKLITLSRTRMLACEPCWTVDGMPMDGWECSYGVVIVKAENGKAWMEFHGDDENFREGGLTFGPDGDGTDVVMRNLLPAGHVDRLVANPNLYIGAVNRWSVANCVDGCTFYNARPGMSGLVPSYRFAGHVRSVTVRPPVLGPSEPLNAWIEVDVSEPRGRVEVPW